MAKPGFRLALFATLLALIVVLLGAYTRLTHAGLGVKAVERLLMARRVRRLRSDDLKRLHVPIKKVMAFVEVTDHRPGRALEASDLVARLRPVPVQASLFSA